MILTMVVTSDLWVSSKANESRHGYMKLSGVSCATRNFHSFFCSSFIHSFIHSCAPHPVYLFINACTHACVHSFIHRCMNSIVLHRLSCHILHRDLSFPRKIHLFLFFFSSEKILPSFTRLWSKSLKFEIFRRYCHCLYCYCCFCCCCCCCCRHVMFTTSSF